jgi:ABC-2 type transport system permease protein
VTVVDRDRISELPLVDPSANAGLSDVFKRRYLLRLLVAKEIQARYSGSVLGLLWSYVMPLARFLMYYFVIGLVLRLHSEVPNFAIHLFCGLVFVHFFTETFNSGTRSIVRNKAIVRKMAMPREMFPVAATIVSAVHAFPQAVILVIASLVVGWSFSVTALGAAVLGFAILALFGTGLALLFSALNVYFRDFSQVVALLTVFTHWAVPMIYPYSRLAESSMGGTWVEEVYLADPLAEAVLLLQRAFWVPTCPGHEVCTGPNAMPADLFARGGIMLVIGVIFLLGCQWAFTRMESSFAERLVA